MKRKLTTEAQAQIQQFDDALFQKTQYERVIEKFIRTILVSISGLLYLIPFHIKQSSDLKMYLFTDIILFWVVLIYTAQLTGIMEKQKRISLFEKLKYTPINPEVFYYDRLKKVELYIRKIMTILSIIQIFSSVIFRAFSYQTLLHLAFIWIFMLGLSFLQVYSSYKLAYRSFL